MDSFVHRPLGDQILRQHNTPVLIVEGARAVGKTTMAKRQLEANEGYRYFSLADQTTRERALADVDAWLRSMPTRVVIDEAQLVAALPLALKEHVDSVGTDHHFVLTGSASIGRAGLGGADPLTRRSQRFTMHPLTRWEIDQQAGSLVDALFDLAPVLGRYKQATDVELLDVFRLGGFPTYLFPQSMLTRSQLRGRLATDISAVLSDSVEPGLNVNLTKARAALDALLRTPGGILNAASLGRHLSIDKRTVEQYVDHFGRLFLLQWLPNLATAPRKQDFSRAKIHPFDLSLATDALERSGVNLVEKREFFGQVLESHVVIEILANAQWAKLGTQAYYWRQASSTSPEVDLVLIDETERVVAVEVKAASSVGDADLKGIRALRQQRSVHRAFVFYRGDVVIQLDASAWALPISLLGDGMGFRRDESVYDPAPSTTETRLVLPPNAAHDEQNDFDATVFLSYVRDDDLAQKGRIVKFVHDLIDMYSFLYGHSLDLFIDREDIHWGEKWSDRLSSKISETTFLLCVVTPRFLRSGACRHEVLDFSAAARQSGVPKLLLPLLLVDIEDTDVVSKDDPVLKRLLESQYEDVKRLRTLQPDGIEYEQLVENVARRLKSTVDIHVKRAIFDQSAPNPEGSDIFELMAKLAARGDEIEAGVTDFTSAFQSVITEFEAKPLPLKGSGSEMSAAFSLLGHRLEKPCATLDQATTTLGRSWESLDSLISEFMQMVSGMPGNIRADLNETLEGLERSLVMPGLDELEPMILMMGKVSRHLRPASRALTGSIRLLRGIQESARAWRKRL